jgi:phage/plasmid-like protein (TIGR03299 family)
MHNIAFINGKAAMAYQGKMPWHQLGIQMPEKVDVAAAMKAANLDWLVSSEKLFLENGIYVPGKRAIVRDIDNEILGMVSEDYVPIQNHEAFGILNLACEKFGVEIETAGALGKGEHVWMLAKMPESVEPIPGDRVDGYFLIHTGHNGLIALYGLLTPIRVICNNTLTAAVNRNEALIRLEHIESDVAQLETVEDLIAQLVHTLQVTGESFTELANKHWTFEEVKSYVDEVIGIEDLEEVNKTVYELLEVEPQNNAKLNMRDSVLTLVWKGVGAETAGAKLEDKVEKSTATAWAAYNAFTEYTDHVRPAEAKSESSMLLANRSALFGSNAELKDRALRLALAA